MRRHTKKYSYKNILKRTKKNHHELNYYAIIDAYVSTLRFDNKLKINMSNIEKIFWDSSNLSIVLFIVNDSKISLKKKTDSTRSASIRHCFISRINLVVKMLEQVIKWYGLPDTKFILNISDGYDWKSSPNLPIFNWSVPDGFKNRFIFPNYDMIHTPMNKNDFDRTRKHINAEQNKIYHVENSLYFTGSSTSRPRSKIREFIEKETDPFNITLIHGGVKNHHPLQEIVHYKFLLDLPGAKPWSIRLKYLLLTNRLVIRVSFYNSKERENGYWKQFTDIFFKEGQDYIHLKYDVNYDKQISKKLYKRIKEDLLKIYKKYNKNLKLYTKITSQCQEHAKHISTDSCFYYIHCILKKYTEVYA